MWIVVRSATIRYSVSGGMRRKGRLSKLAKKNKKKAGALVQSIQRLQPKEVEATNSNTSYLLKKKQA